MTHEKKKIIKITAIAASLASIAVATGFGCGMGWQPVGMVTELSSFSIPSDIGDNGDLAVVSGARTVSVANYSSVLDNMSSMANVTPSTTTRNIFNDKVGSFPESPSVLGINAPMAMAYVSVGAEVCNDLVIQEAAAAAANRRFFGNLNLGTANNTSIAALNTDANNDQILDPVADMTRRFARQFWQRNETPEELQIINAGVKEMVAAQAANTQALTRRAALYTCTAMMASTAAYEL